MRNISRIDRRVDRRGGSVSRCSHAPRGFTLLEVILALAILGMSIAVLGQVFRLAHRNAQEARLLTQAQLLAATKMAEISAAITPATEVEGVQFEEAPEWSYSIAAEPFDDPEGLIAVTIVVEWTEPNPQNSIRFTLTRWMTETEIATAEELSSAEDMAAEGENSGENTRAPGGGGDR